MLSSRLPDMTSLTRLGRAQEWHQSCPRKIVLIEKISQNIAQGRGLLGPLFPFIRLD